MLPWFIPGVLLAVALAAVLGGRLARVLQTSRGIASLLIVSLGMVVSATLTPLRGQLDFEGGRVGTCDLSRLWFASPSQLLTMGDESLNVLLFVPLGVAIAFLPWTRRTGAVALGVLAMPLLIELTQALLPVLDRGCQSADVIDNLTGLALGFVAGRSVRWLARAATRNDESLGS